MKKIVISFASVGILIPIIDLVAWTFFKEFLDRYWTMYTTWLKILFLVWPTSLFLLGSPRDGTLSYSYIVVAIGINVGLYALLGYLIWIGISKHRWVLYILIGSVTVLWFVLWHL